MYTKKIRYGKSAQAGKRFPRAPVEPCGYNGTRCSPQATSPATHTSDIANVGIFGGKN